MEQSSCLKESAPWLHLRPHVYWAKAIERCLPSVERPGAVFLMNVTDPAEAHKLLDELPLGRADMMTFELTPVGPLWPLGLLLPEPAK